MRERSTWNREEVMEKAAALKKVADPYTMNQDHPQPPADAYVIGDPSAFAEDVHSPNTWESEYSGGETRRNEIGMPDMRGDTFNHPEKTASKEILLKKADLCIDVAKRLLDQGKHASVTEDMIEDQAVALMHLPDQELIDTHKRLAGEDEDADEDKDEGQEKQAVDMTAMAEQVVQQIQTGNYGAAQQQVQEMIQQAQQDQQQQQQQQVQQDQVQQQVQQDQEQQDQQQQAQQQIQDEQIQQVGQQVQEMIDQALQQQQGQQVMDVMDEQVVMDEDLDDVLGRCQTAETDIQMEPPQMDISNNDLGPEDAVLRQLFAEDQQDKDEEKEGQDQEKGQQQQKQQKQASTRTASTRTVGTRPSEGVSKLGGASSSAGQDGIDQLSSLWKSAPDVRDVFGIK